MRWTHLPWDMQLYTWDVLDASGDLIATGVSDHLSTAIDELHGEVSGKEGRSGLVRQARLDPEQFATYKYGRTVAQAIGSSAGAWWPPPFGSATY